MERRADTKIPVIPGDPRASGEREGDPGIRSRNTEAGNQTRNFSGFRILDTLPLAHSRSAGDDTRCFVP